MFNSMLNAKSHMMVRRAARPRAAAHASAKDHAHAAKISVQAGPNAQPGGCHSGFASDSYQGPISVIVPPAMATAAAHATPAAKGRNRLFFARIMAAGSPEDARYP
jgi:hypothetical protein